MFGIYIHFPYCRKRCPYCDFAVHARRRIPHDRYAACVLDELGARAPLFAGRRAVSVYFGGGTPGLWRPAALGAVLAGALARFPAEGEPEVTVEANPGDLEPATLAELRVAGVNRLSLGVQSLERRHLETLGRLHGAAEAVAAARQARRAGFDNLTLDLMFGLPAQSLGQLERDLDGVLALEPDHLSVYSLTVEPRTAFGALERRGALRLPSNERSAEMFERVQERLVRAGFEHYEISSYARPGKRAVHNTLYWTGGEYLGLGCSAHSHRRLPGGAERFATVRSVDDYFAVQGRMGGVPLPTDPAVASYEQLSPAAVEGEALWLGLRLLEGVSRRAHAARYGADPAERHAPAIQRLEGEGLIERSGERLRLTARGVLWADEVGARLVVGAEAPPALAAGHAGGYIVEKVPCRI